MTLANISDFPLLRFAGAAFVLALLAACVTPIRQAESLAASYGYTRQVLAGKDFSHVAYSRAGHGDRLHVYIENDGVPWLGRYFVASDPTAGRPLMLELMALDPAPSLYLGRPCYLGQAQAPPCTQLSWTHERYSAQVVESLAAALQSYLQRQPYKQVALFGHSGGGALATLLAEGVPETVAVVTLAGTLNVAAWTAYHRYSPLAGSLDPATRAPLGTRILQWHYIGGRDGNVPGRFTRAYAADRPAVRVQEIADYDHGCCWKRLWPDILRELEAALPNVTSPAIANP